MPAEIGADGRHSPTRAKARLEVMSLGAPMDVLWMRISRRSSDPDQTFGRVEAGRMLVMINRRDYWQCAFVIPKESFDDIQRNGLEAFRADIVGLAPYLQDRVGETVLPCEKPLGHFQWEMRKSGKLVERSDKPYPSEKAARESGENAVERQFRGDTQIVRRANK